MADYSLLKKLQEKPQPVTPPLLPEGIKYEEYEVDAYDCGTLTVFVPESESEAFEAALMEHTVLVRADIRALMRAHRGIIK